MENNDTGAPTLTPQQIWNKAIMVADNVCHNRVNIFAGSKGGLWVNGKPIDGKVGQTINIKYKGKADILVFLDVWCWGMIKESRQYPVHDESWSAIEWLDESNPQTSAIEICRKEITQYFNDEYHIKKMLGTEPPEDNGPI